MNGTCKGCGAPLAPSRNPGNPRKWCSERCRKNQYDLVCVACGGRASGTDPGRMFNRDEPVCITCSREHYAVWTPDAIVLAIQEWADAHGGIPPTANDWNRAHAISNDAVPVVNQVCRQ